MTVLVASRFAIFNNWNFNNVPGLQVYAIDPPGQGNRTLTITALARRAARKVSSAFYQANNLSIGVYIEASSREALETAMDTLYANIQALEGSLVVPRSGSVRQYTATYSTTAINNKMQNTNSPASNTADLTLVFECSDSFGYDTNYTVIAPAQNITGSPFTVQYTQAGSAETQVPIIQAKLTAFTGTNPSTVIIGNTNTGAAIQITHTWSVNDILIVDTQNKKVQVNGVDVSFTGGWPEVGIGLQSLYIQDGFTTRTWNLYMYVYNRYN